MKTGRKKTGGKYQASRKKKMYEKPGQRRITKLGEDKRKSKKVMGGKRKVFLLKSKSINVQDNGKL